MHTHGTNGDGLPHYYVQLTGKQLSEFEIFDSLCSNESYESLIYICEQKLNQGILPVLPGEVIDVLLTLGSIGIHKGQSTLRRHDPVNVGKCWLPKRSLRLLNNLLDILIEFDCDTYDCHSLELLRCQFFYFLDRIKVVKGRSLVEGNVFEKSASTNENRIHSGVGFFVGDSTDESLPRLYNSYVSLIDANLEVFKTPLVTRIVSGPGSFWNLISWSLANSMDDTKPMYSSARLWLSIARFLFRVYHIRLEYTLLAEIESFRENSIDVRNYITNSKFFELFEGVDNKNMCQGLLDYIFVGCVKHDELKPIAPLANELELSKTYIAQFKSSECDNISDTMVLRRSILNLFSKFDRLLHGEKEHENKLSKNFVRIVVDWIFYEFSTDIFRYFFISTASLIDYELLSRLAESFVQKCFDSFQIHYVVQISDNMKSHVDLANELLQIIGLLRKSPVIGKARFANRKMQLEFSVLLFGHFGTYVHGSTKFKSIPGFEEKIKIIGTDPRLSLKDLQKVFRIH